MSSPALFVLVPGRLDARTGGDQYDRRMVRGLRARGWTVDVQELDGSFPQPTATALDQAARVLAAIPDRAVVLVDGLALGSMPEQVEREQRRLRIVALVHASMANEVGLDEQTAARFAISERRALAGVRLAVVTGRSTVPVLADYGVALDRIVIVEPGTDRGPLAQGSQTSTPGLELLCVATLNTGKGHDILIQALAMVPRRAWHLTCAGSLDRDPAAAHRVRELVRAKRLDDCVSLAGELDGPALEACWNRADLFVLGTLRETYGMAVAEALAHGLPVVSTATGAIPDLVGPAAGLIVPPGDAAALAGALTRVVGDAPLRARLAAGARAARERLPTWEAAFSKMAAALESAATGD